MATEWLRQLAPAHSCRYRSGAGLRGRESVNSEAWLPGATGGTCRTRTRSRRRTVAYDGRVSRLIVRAVIAAGCALSVVLLGTLAGPANLNVLLVAAIVIPVVVIGLFELPRFLRRHL